MVWSEESEHYQETQEALRLEIPLVDRLRDCGPFRASDGYLSVATGYWKDAHEGADEIERLRMQLTQRERELKVLREKVTNALTILRYLPGVVLTSRPDLGSHGGTTDEVIEILTDIVRTNNNE